MKITFLGAANLVTGSNFLITTGKHKILLDCGLFQGGKETEKLNTIPFDYDPSEIDFLILSHAHIDHSGRIPKLVKEGFRGSIYCTRATSDLAEVLLKDSGHIHEMEAQWTNKKRLRKGLEEIEPLYTVEDAENSLQYLEPVLYDQTTYINDSVRLRFQDAGHILGSSIVELWIKENDQETKIVFSGDLGMKDRPLLRNPSYIEEADYLIMESTYGNRLHENVDTRASKLVDILLSTTRKGGTVVIPSFAVGRTQELIYELNKVYDGDSRIEELLNIPVYIDSPMAISATEIFRKHADVFDAETRDYILRGDNPLDFYNLHFTKKAEESKALNMSDEPKIIISASGMCDAGRIKHHLKHNLWKSNASVVFVGYQAEGTLGRYIRDGNKNVKVFGETIQVKAEIHSIEGFSGHADKEDLMDWLRGFKKLPKEVFVVHGEKESTAAFAEYIKNELKVKTIVPNLNEEFDLDGHKTVSVEPQPSMSDHQHQELIQDVDDISSLFTQTVNLSNKILKLKLQSKDYDTIKNQLIELEKDLLDLNMLLGDKEREV